jgi:hypothetical protein
MGGLWAIVGLSREPCRRVNWETPRQENETEYADFCHRFWPMFDTVESVQAQKQVWEEMANELAPLADLSRYSKKD